MEDPMPSSNNSSEAGKVDPVDSNPQNWSTWTKGACIGTISLGEFIVPFVSMMLAPSLPQVMTAFSHQNVTTESGNFSYGGHEELGSFAVTVYMIGIALGLVVFGPLSDVYGRLSVSRLAAYCYTVSSVACALSPSIQFLIAFRLIAGFFGGAPMVIGGSVVADLYPPGQRDNAMAGYTAGPAIGPVMGSVVGSLINNALGWRWVFWFASILSGIYALLCALVLKETHQRSSQKSSVCSEECRDRPKPRMEVVVIRVRETAKLLQVALITPVKILLFPSILLIILVVAVFTGFSNIVMSSLGTVYQDIYRFPESTAGLGYVAIGIGAIASLFFAKKITKRLAKALSRTEERSEKANGESKFGHRNYLPMVIVASILACVGWPLYGWANQTRVHWIVSMVGLVFYGVASTTIRVSACLFVVDAVLDWSGSAMTALIMITSIFAAVVPISTFPLYRAIGIGWTYTFMALTQLVFCVPPLLLFIFGAKLKGRWTILVRIEGPKD